MATTTTARTKSANSTKGASKNENIVKVVEPSGGNSTGGTVELDLNAVTGTKVQDSLLVRVKSNLFGTLIYRNNRNGEVTCWDGNGDVQLMTIGDLRAMRADQVGFFKNQWIVILGVADGEDSTATCADIYSTLAIKQYYKNYIDPGDFESICNTPISEIKDRVGMVSASQKGNLIVALNGYIQSGRLDSVSKIRAFEEALGVELLGAE